MGWVYIKEQSNANMYNDILDQFVDKCLIDASRLSKELQTKNMFIFTIRTDGEYDKLTSKDGKIFFKSKFLASKTFKKRLIDYYQPLGIFVSGPGEVDKLSRWYIKLSKKLKTTKNRYKLPLTTF